MNLLIERINTGNISNELLLVYSLIAIVILLIIVVLVVDKINSRKKDKLFHSKHLSKRLKELRLEQQAQEGSMPKKHQEVAIEKKEEKVVEIIEEKTQEPETEILEVNFEEEQEPIFNTQQANFVEKTEEKPLGMFERIEALERNSMVSVQQQVQQTPVIEEKEEAEEILETYELEEVEFVEQLETEYKELDLEKTQAQIEIEAITKALERAVEEEKDLDKYAKFEEEQEQNAIISYQELKEKYDELYDSNEKIQYANDDTLPINLEELYQSQDQEMRSVTEEFYTQPEQPIVERKVRLEDLYQGRNSAEFRSSPIISPVYGIQKEEFHEKRELTKEQAEEELQKTTDFLNSLKELQRNLD